MLKKNAYLTLIFGIVLCFTVEFLRLFNDGLLEKFWRHYNGNVIEPLEILSVLLFGTGLYLLLFNQTIQQAWWRWARWAFVLLVSIIVIVAPADTGTGFITIGGTTELVALWGFVFAVATVVHTLILRFYYRTGIQDKNKLFVIKN